MNMQSKIANAFRTKKVTIELNFFAPEINDAYPDPDITSLEKSKGDRNGAVANFFRFELFGKIMQYANREMHVIRVHETAEDERAFVQRTSKEAMHHFSQAFSSIKQSYVKDGTKHISFTITTNQNPDTAARQMVEMISATCGMLLREVEGSADAYEQWLHKAYRSLISCALDMTFTGPTKFNYMSVSAVDV